MRRAVVLLWLTACGPGSRGSATAVDGDLPDLDAGADAALATSCQPAGDGWVMLGGQTIDQALGVQPGWALRGSLVAEPVPTVCFTLGHDQQPDVRFDARVVELRDGAWHALGAPLEPTVATRLGINLARDADNVWLVSTDRLSTTAFGGTFFDDTDVRLARWDGATWHELATPLNDLSHHTATFGEQQQLPLEIDTDGTVLGALREFIEEPEAEGPWQGHVRVSRLDGESVDRQLATLPGWDQDGYDRYPTGLHAGSARDVLVVSTQDSADATVFIDSGSGWTPAAAGSLGHGHVAGSLLTADGRIVLITYVGTAWASNGQATWSQLGSLPFMPGTQLTSMRTRTSASGQSFVGWVEYLGDTEQRFGVARLDGNAWTSLDVGMPEELVDRSWNAVFAIDDCGRPLVLATMADFSLGVWRFDGVGEPID